MVDRNLDSSKAHVFTKVTIFGESAGALSIAIHLLGKRVAKLARASASANHKFQRHAPFLTYVLDYRVPSCDTSVWSRTARICLESLC